MCEQVPACQEWWVQKWLAIVCLETPWILRLECSQLGCVRISLFLIRWLSMSLFCWLYWFIFSARQHAERAICYRKSACPSVRPSVCMLHGWISRKRLNLESCSFHHTVAPSLYFLQDKFHPEIPPQSPRAAASNKGDLRKPAIFVVLKLSLGGCTS